MIVEATSRASEQVRSSGRAVERGGAAWADELELSWRLRSVRLRADPAAPLADSPSGIPYVLTEHVGVRAEHRFGSGQGALAGEQRAVGDCDRVRGIVASLSRTRASASAFSGRLGPR